MFFYFLFIFQLQYFHTAFFFKYLYKKYQRQLKNRKDDGSETKNRQQKHETKILHLIV